MEEDTGTFDSYLDTHNNLSRYSISEPGKGQHAVTNFKVTKRMIDATAVELELVTARRHQARVQLFESGHHVLGDTRYRKARYGHERWEKKRLAMHGTQLTFIHPESGKEVTYKSELPISMRKFIRGGKQAN